VHRQTFGPAPVRGGVGAGRIAVPGRDCGGVVGRVVTVIAVRLGRFRSLAVRNGSTLRRGRVAGGGRAVSLARVGRGRLGLGPVGIGRRSGERQAWVWARGSCGRAVGVRVRLCQGPCGEGPPTGVRGLVAEARAAGLGDAVAQSLREGGTGAAGHQHRRARVP
jgi:hypothetical protein